MNTTHSIHAEMTVAITMWALLMIIAHVSATWNSCVVPHANTPPTSEQSKIAETVCGPPVETLALSQSALPWLAQA